MIRGTIKHVTASAIHDATRDATRSTIRCSLVVARLTVAKLLRPSLIRSASGHSLLELMIAMALGLTTAAATIALYRSQRALTEHIEGATASADAGTAALGILAQHIRLAGFLGTDPDRQAGSSDNVAPGVWGCEAGRPSAGPSGAAAECVADPRGSDSIVLRYRADTVASWGSEAGRYPTDCLLQGVKSTDAIVENRFYVALGSGGVPSLYCRGSGAANAQPLLEAVELLQLRYWLRGGSGPVGAASLNAAQWRQVAAVDLCVAVRHQSANRVGVDSRNFQPDQPADLDHIKRPGQIGPPPWQMAAVMNSRDGPPADCFESIGASGQNMAQRFVTHVALRNMIDLEEGTAPGMRGKTTESTRQAPLMPGSK